METENCTIEKLRELSSAVHRLAMAKVEEGVNSTDELTIVTGLIYAFKELAELELM